MKEKIIHTHRLDYLLIFAYLILTIIGWISIFASSYDPDKFTKFTLFNLNTLYGKQLLWILMSFILAVVILILDVKFLVNMAIPFYWVTIILLVLTLVIGTIIAGNKGWINLGNGILLQPTEFVKYAVSLVLAYLLNLPAFNLENKKNIYLLIAIVVLPTFIVLLQNDAGNAVVFISFFFLFYRLGLPAFFFFLFFYAIVLFFLSLLIKQYVLISIITLLMILSTILLNKNRKAILKILISWVFSIVLIVSTNYVFFHVLKKHQQDRINVLIGREYDERGSAFNIQQSLVAIGSGGLTGKGFMQGTQTRYNFVPAQATDFIFSAIGEQLGFIGSTFVILLYVLIILRMFNLAEKQRSTFSTVFIYSTAFIIFVHVVINIGMTLSLVPVIGIPLPFVSYGGSSFLAFTLMYFTVIKLNMHKNEVL